MAETSIDQEGHVSRENVRNNMCPGRSESEQCFEAFARLCTSMVWFLSRVHGLRLFFICTSVLGFSSTGHG